MTTTPLIAGIELGGTKCVAILATGPDDVREEVRVPTTTPDETLAALDAVLDRWAGFEGIGVASFGPLFLDPDQPDYGRIANTPKPGWARVDLAGRLAERYRVPVGFHTDVVGAALGEAAWGAAEGVRDLAYVTVGTGIGVGLVVDGRPLGGMTHAELGHLRPVRAKGDEWIGACPFHGDCVEGLASGPAIAARTGVPAPELSADDPAWDLAAHALAQLAHALVVTGVPRRIVWGGGVMVGVPHLMPRLRRKLHDSLAGYLVTPELENLDAYLVPARLGAQAGPLGAVVLGQQALAARPFTGA